MTHTKEQASQRAKKYLIPHKAHLVTIETVADLIDVVGLLHTALEAAIKAGTTAEQSSDVEHFPDVGNMVDDNGLSDSVTVYQVNLDGFGKLNMLAPPTECKYISKTYYTRAEQPVSDTFDYQRVKEWALSSPRKPANQSFTDSTNRQVAYLIEDLQPAVDVPDIILQAIRSYRDEHCFDDSEYGIAIDAFFSTLTKRGE